MLARINQPVIKEFTPINRSEDEQVDLPLPNLTSLQSTSPSKVSRGSRGHLGPISPKRAAELDEQMNEEIPQEQARDERSPVRRSYL